MTDSHIKSLIKATSWRLFGTSTTILIGFLFTKRLDFALYIGGVEFFSKFLLFYLHERIWIEIPKLWHRLKNFSLN